MRVLIGYDGSKCADAAVSDLPHAGLPESGEMMVVAAAEPPPVIATGAVLAAAAAGEWGASFPAEADPELMRQRAGVVAAALASQCAAQLRREFPGWRVTTEVATESPAYPHAHDAFRAVGAQVVTVPVGRDGWDEAHLAATLERARPVLAYLMPDFQNPTGASMPPALRERVCRTAAHDSSVRSIRTST